MNNIDLEKYKFLAENSTDWIYWINQENHIEYCSESFEQISGYSAKELLENPDLLINIIHLDDVEFFKQHISESHNSTDSDDKRDIEFRIIHKNGDIKYIHHICKSIYEDGKYLGRLASNRDVTIQKIQEEKLRKDEDKLKLITESMNDVIWELDAAFNIKFISPSVEYSTGYKPEEAIGKPLWEFLKAEHLDYVRKIAIERIELFKKTKKLDSVLYEVEQRRKDGSYHWIEVHSNPIISAAGELVGYIGVNRDISKRKEYMMLLENSSKRLNSVMDITNNGIWDWNLKTNNAFFSDKYYTMLGYEPNEYEANYENWRNSVHPDDIENAEKKVEEHFARKLEEFNVELRIQTKQNTWKWINCKGRVVEWDSEGNPTRMLGVHIDIDVEKRQKEEKLLLLSSAIKSASNGIVITDINGNIEFTNPAFTELTQYSLEDAIGKNPRDLVNSKLHTKEFFKKMWETILSGQHWSGEIINRRKDGSIYTEDLTITPVKNLNNEITNFIAIKQDITEQKELIRSLNQTNSELQAIYDNSPVMICVLDKSQKIIFANKTLTDYLGMPLSHLSSRRACGAFGCIHKDDHPDGCGFGFDCSDCMLNIALNDTLLTGKSNTSVEHYATLEINGERKDIVLLASTSLIKNESGEFLLLNLLDITQKKAAEIALEKSLNMFREYVQNAPMGIFVIDTKGCFKGCNKAIEEHFLMSEEDIKKENFRKFVVDKWEDLTPKLIDLENRNPHNCELLLSRTDMSVFWAQLNSVWISGDEILCFIQDITKKKQIDEEQESLLEALRESNLQIEAALYQKNQLIEELEESRIKLEDALSAKDKFFSIIAHDLRGPFSGFLGLSDMLAKDLEELSVKDLKRMSQAIYKSATSVYKLLDDLLQWSRLQLGSIPFNPEQIQLKMLASTTAYTLKEVAESKEIKVSINIIDTVNVCCDRNMITGVFRNLISNAIKFTNRGGLVEVGTGNETDNFIEVYVKDNGIGIESDVIEKVLRIDEHYTTTGTEKESGSGLGLILCKEFIEKHSGTIRVESKLNEGSKFIFTLPKSCMKQNES